MRWNTDIAFINSVRGTLVNISSVRKRERESMYNLLYVYIALYRVEWQLFTVARDAIA